MSRDGREQIIRQEKRYLGTFTLPWATVYENDCKVEGRFRVETPISFMGYEDTMRGNQGGGGDAGMENESPMFICASVTVDR